MLEKLKNSISETKTVHGTIFKNFLFGVGYLPAANIFALLVFSILVIHPMSLFSNLLFIFEKHPKMIKYAAVSSVCNIILNFLLIPKYGMNGAAIATLFTFFVYIILLWRAGKEIYDFKIWRGLLKPLAASLAMGIIVYIFEIIGIHILVNIALSAVIYFLILYFLKERLLREIFSFIKTSFSGR